MMFILAFLMMTLTHASVMELNVRMPGSSPQHPDTYLCTGVKVPAGDWYITHFQPLAEMNTVHHMFLHGCGAPAAVADQMEGKIWDCQRYSSCGGGKSAILYAWGRNAGPLNMPKNSGMHVGGSSGYTYLVAELHYLHVKQFTNGKKDHSGVRITLDNTPKPNIAGIYLVAGAGTWSWSIPAHVKKYHMDAGCTYKPSSGGPVFHAFRFRVHTHSLGSVVTGYRVRDDKWTLIGKGDPQQPQAFNPTTSVLDIKPGDTLMMRCTYNSQGRDRVTNIGSTHKDEMCNFYIMYYYDASKHGEIGYVPCEREDKLRQLKYPEDSDVPLITSSSATSSTQMDEEPSKAERIVEEIVDFIIDREPRK